MREAVHGQILFLPCLALSLGRRIARIETGMALDMQERHAFEHEEGRSPVWIGMAWGAVSLLGGVALLAAMLTFVCGK